MKCVYCTRLATTIIPSKRNPLRILCRRHAEREVNRLAERDARHAVREYEAQQKGAPR